jgi:hypothetical protein
MNQPTGIMTVQWPSRYDLRWPARITTGLLAAVVGLNLHGILALAEGRPGRLLLQWMIVGAATGLSFLAWSARARAVTRPPGPFATRMDGWTVTGWFCPIANLWIPYQVMGDILRSSERQAESVPGPSARHRSGTALVRSWWVLWLSTWVTFWGSVSILVVATYRNWGTVWAQRVLDLAFQLVSIGAAVCAMTIVITVTRRTRRAVGPAFSISDPASSPAPAATLSIRGTRRERMACAGVAIGGLAFSTLVSVLAMDIPILNVPLARLQPSVAMIVGTFHAGDDGTLDLTRDGRFVGTALPYDLSAGGIRAATRWSGAGTWKIGTCGVQDLPGICLRPFEGNMSDGLTVGARSSPVLQIPVDPHYVEDSEFPHTTTLVYASYYELRKTR